jgi:hypothetical protein
VAGLRPVLLERDLQHLVAAEGLGTLDGYLVGPSPQVEARLRRTSVAASAKVALDAPGRPTSIP